MTKRLLLFVLLMSVAAFAQGGAGDEAVIPVLDTELNSDYSGVGACTNQFARALNDNAAPTCETVTASDAAVTFVVEGDLGNGLEAVTNTVHVDLLDTGDGTGSASSLSGMEFQGAGSDELTLLQGCADAEILKWVDGTTSWDCAPDAGGQAIFLDSCQAVTIATGAVTVTGSANQIRCATIDTESAAAQDDLTTFNCPAATFWMLGAANDARTVTMQATTGPDFNLDNTLDRLYVECRTANTPLIISRAGQNGT